MPQPVPPRTIKVPTAKMNPYIQSASATGQPERHDTRQSNHQIRGQPPEVWPV